ncbi:MAG: Arm DNA-binding domain-containing protein, partial [Alphaproteobacteria bacterium]
MAEKSNLDAKTIENAKKREKPYRLSDRGGLLLQVNKSGSKDWLVRVTIAGKRRDMGLGGWPVVTLAEARAKALAVQREIEAGLDPIEKKRAENEKAKADREAREEEDKRIFEAALDAYLKAEAPSWKTAKTAKSWRASLK